LFRIDRLVFYGRGCTANKLISPAGKLVLLRNGRNPRLLNPTKREIVYPK